VVEAEKQTFSRTLLTYIDTRRTFLNLLFGCIFLPASLWLGASITVAMCFGYIGAPVFVGLIRTGLARIT
jgi:hypothetical protein